MATTKVALEEQIAVLMRGVEYGDPNIYATMERELRERLVEGRPLRVYCGFDPTSTDLTLGNLVPMLKMRQFQRFGHEVTFLIGTMTATVGDPSGRTGTRPMQTPEEVEQKAETWLGQAFRVLDPKLTLVKRNGDWLAPLSLSDLVQIASNFTVSQFLSHDMFRQRYEQNLPIHLHELIYALMQGYDAFAMNTDVQIGGTDQLFNIMAGRTIQRAHGQRPQVAVLTPILTGTDGHLKMSKSFGNYIGLDDPPADMFGKVMSIPDSLIPEYFTLLTSVPEAEVAAMRRNIDSAATNPMELKKRLGREVVALLYDEQAAAAQAEFERVFQRREEPERTTEFQMSLSRDHVLTETSGHEVSPSGEVLPASQARERTYSIPHILVAAGAVPSISEARRLISQGAVSVTTRGNTEKVRTVGYRLRNGSLIRVGSHRFVTILDIDTASRRVSEG